MHMLNVAVCHGCLLVLLACATCFKGMCINTCFICLVGLFVCFSCFFWLILIILILIVCCCRILNGHNFPFSAVLCYFRALFFCFRVWDMISWCFASCSDLFFFFPSFLDFFYVVFPVMVFCPLLQCPIILHILGFFLVLPCAYASYAIYACMGGTWLPLTHPLFPYVICDGHVPTSPSLSTNFPPHTLAKIMPFGPICASVYLVLRLLGANASPYTHPNPSPPSRVPRYPFMSAHTYVSFLGKFPGHTWPEIMYC